MARENVDPLPYVSWEKDVREEQVGCGHGYRKEAGNSNFHVIDEQPKINIRFAKDGMYM